MKSKISYSRFSTILTATLLGALFIACIATVREQPVFFILLATYLILIIFILFFGAAYIKADSNNIILGSLLRSKKIPMVQVESVELFQPPVGAIRIYGSGGFMGYWGLFRDGGIGRYYAFYGKASECFLVTLNTGKKYIIGCNYPVKMADYINSRISR